MIATWSLFELDEAGYEALRDDPEWMSAELGRVERMSEFETEVLASGFFHVLEEIVPPTVAADRLPVGPTLAPPGDTVLESRPISGGHLSTRGSVFARRASRRRARSRLPDCAPSGSTAHVAGTATKENCCQGRE